MTAKLNRRNFITGVAAASLAGSSRNRELKAGAIPGKQSGQPTIRIGVIGFGFRGEQLARAAKFAHPDWTRKMEKNKNPSSRIALENYRNQEDLDVKISGICDLYDPRVERGMEAAGNGARAFKNYRDLLKSNDIDAVIIATPDHWHARMAIEAAQAGKHVYLEKCMTRTAEEAMQLRDAVKESGIVFQLGHQGRQRDLNLKAKEIIGKGTLGKISLIETTTNRNDPAGAWIYPIPEKIDPGSIDWHQFQEAAPSQNPFTPERFFRWRCYWDYGSGLAGDLLTHEYDAINSILDLGIPHSASASGGIYFYKDGREVPDVFHVIYEYPQKDLTLTYSATLSSGISRGTLVMGHDATLELGRTLSLWVDKESTLYRSRIEAGMIDPASPIARYTHGAKEVDAISSPTSKYFADRGLMYTYRDGTRVNPTTLHLKEWIESIRGNGRTGCDIEQGFQEAITAHMATKSFLEERQVHYDSVSEKII